MLVPIEADEDGAILDGHHRGRACLELGIKDWPSIIRLGLSEEQKIEHALTLNLTRRHLTREQRREVVLTLRQKGWSSTRIAERLGVSDQTVLNDLATSKNLEVALPDRVIGKDGKCRPVSRPAVMAKSSREAHRALKALAVVGSGQLPNGLLEARLMAGLANRIQQQQLPEAPPLPAGRYRCLVIDPPWQYEARADDATHRAQSLCESVTGTHRENTSGRDSR